MDGKPVSLQNFFACMTVVEIGWHGLLRFKTFCNDILQDHCKYVIFPETYKYSDICTPHLRCNEWISSSTRRRFAGERTKPRQTMNATGSPWLKGIIALIPPCFGNGHGSPVWFPYNYTNALYLHIFITTSLYRLFWYWALEIELLLGKWHPSPRDLPAPKANRDSVDVMKCEMD